MVPGSTPGVGKVKFFSIFLILWCGGMSIDKKIIVDHLERGYCGGGGKNLLYTLVKGPSPMLGHFGVRFKVFGRGVDSRGG